MITRTILRSIVGLGIVVVAVQVAPSRHPGNPAARDTIVAPPEVMHVLRRSCFDCHSNETRWPWYSHVAPAKWLVRHDVVEGREHLNFSEWNHQSVGKRAELWEEIIEVVYDGSMPPRVYVPLHPGSRLTADERRVLEAWGRRYASHGDARR